MLMEADFRRFLHVFTACSRFPFACGDPPRIFTPSHTVVARFFCMWRLNFALICGCESVNEQRYL